VQLKLVVSGISKVYVQQSEMVSLVQSERGHFFALLFEAEVTLASRTVSPFVQ